jgi:hypothetical protein
MALKSLNDEFHKSLAEVQELYGRRDETWTACVDAHEGAAKADSKKYRSELRVVVAVNPCRGHDFLRFDLLHECTHVLNPWLDLKEVSYLEEAAAVAVSFSPSGFEDLNFVAVQREGLRGDSEKKNYQEAITDLEKLTANCSDLIKRLRGEKRLSLSTDINPEDITRLIPGSEIIASRLCRKFYPNG